VSKLKKDTKLLIIQTAYLLFLEKGYDAVSIRMIQEAAGIGKATMYHYFSSKQELFELIIQMNFNRAKVDDNENEQGILLSQHIKERIVKARTSLEHSTLPKSIGMLNFFIMNFQAMEMNPKLADLGKEIHDREVDAWQTYIQNSIDYGEVKPEIDINRTAKLFMNVRHGIGVTSTYQTSMEENIDEIEEMYHYIFSLIRK